jgi:hypothetical protein
MNNYQQPSGLTIGLGFLIDDNWTAEQAWAVVELLDDLRGRIMSHYLIPIQELLREERGMTGDQQEERLNMDDLDF